MKNIHLLFLFFSPFSLYGQSLLQKQFPDGLLTDDYGLLSKQDLVYETMKAYVTPFKLEEVLSPYHRWQCFETKKIKFVYHSWRDDLTDFGPGATLCTYSFNVTDKSGVSHMYISRRAKDVLDCRELFLDWKKIRKNSEYTCLVGEPASYENKQKAWIWGKVKTKNGCLSYFLGECDTNKKIKELSK